MGVREVKQPSGPRGRHFWDEVAPECVLVRLVDRVIFSCQVVHGEAHGECLLIVLIRIPGGMKFVRFGLCLSSSDKLCRGQRKQISQFCGIDKILSDIPLRKRKTLR